MDRFRLYRSRDVSQVKRDSQPREMPGPQATFAANQDII
jgi:hypothetical protein